MAYPGFQRGGCLRSGPIRKVGEGGGGGGECPLQVRYTKSGGGGGGGIPLQVRYLCTFVWHTENIYMYLPTCYLGILHTRARMNVKYMPAKVNLLQFFCHPYVRGGGGACTLHAPPPPPPPPPPPLNPPLNTVCFAWGTFLDDSSLQEGRGLQQRRCTKP